MYQSNVFKLTFLSLACIYICCAQTVLNSPHSGNSSTIHRVAFVFAGTARSFIIPPVHETIRANLIASFCPIATCRADVFLRISTTDNRHEGLDAVGITSKGDPNDIPKIEKAVSRINPHSHVGGRTILDWTDIGSEKEKSEMLLHFPNQRHKVFRTLDPRRYSMHFNRWAAYNMATDLEGKNDFKYSWVIHSRLDAVWGEPIRDFSNWPTNRVWVPDTWWSDVADTFAMLERSWSDRFDVSECTTMYCCGLFTPQNPFGS